jgi:transposase
MNQGAALEIENHSLRERVSNLQEENRLLRRKIDALIRRYYGKSSEAFDPAQLELIVAGLMAGAQPPSEAELNAVARKPAPQPRQRPARRLSLPADVPTERVVLEPPEVQQQPELWKQIGEEVTEEWDYTPGQFLKRLYVRPKYVRREGVVPALVSPLAVPPEVAESPAVVIATLPPRLIEKGLPGAGLLTHVLISKYADHLPLYRQEKIYEQRHGVKLPRQMLAEWVEHGAFWLRPIYDEMKRGLLAGGYLQADETPIRYLDPDLPGAARQGYLWTYSRPGGDVIFDWQTSRGRAVAEEFLKSFGGLLQTDGYCVYENLAAGRRGLVLVGCWTHARRKFVEALEEDRRAAWVVRQLGQLYQLESRLRSARAGPAGRAAARAADARPVLRRLEHMLRHWQPQVLPRSLLGEAIGYALERWEALCRYVLHGEVEIDNNLIENAIRPTAIGKKNFLFIGHPDAGWRSAVIYSVLGSCRRYGVDPHEYLRDVLRRLPAMKISEIAQVTPAAWARAKRTAANRAA